MGERHFLHQVTLAVALARDSQTYSFFFRFVWTLPTFSTVKPNRSPLKLLQHSVLAMIVGFQRFQEFMEGEDEVVIAQAVIDSRAFLAGTDEVQLEQLVQMFRGGGWSQSQLSSYLSRS